MLESRGGSNNNTSSSSTSTRSTDHTLAVNYCDCIQRNRWCCAREIIYSSIVYCIDLCDLFSVYVRMCFIVCTSCFHSFCFSISCSGSHTRAQHSFSVSTAAACACVCECRGGEYRGKRTAERERTRVLSPALLSRIKCVYTSIKLILIHKLALGFRLFVSMCSCCCCLSLDAVFHLVVVYCFFFYRCTLRSPYSSLALAVCVCVLSFLYTRWTLCAMLFSI